jgi:hypothetical protein
MAPVRGALGGGFCPRNPTLYGPKRSGRAPDPDRRVGKRERFTFRYPRPISAEYSLRFGPKRQSRGEISDLGPDAALDATLYGLGRPAWTQECNARVGNLKPFHSHHSRP